VDTSRTYLPDPSRTDTPPDPPPPHQTSTPPILPHFSFILEHQNYIANTPAPSTVRSKWATKTWLLLCLLVNPHLSSMYHWIALTLISQNPAHRRSEHVPITPGSAAAWTASPAFKTTCKAIEHATAGQNKQYDVIEGIRFALKPMTPMLAKVLNRSGCSTGARMEFDISSDYRSRRTP